MMQQDAATVYVLYDGSQVVYVGRTTTSVEERLRLHELDGFRYTRAQVKSGRVPLEKAQAIEKELLQEYLAKHNGRRPRYNQSAA